MALCPIGWATTLRVIKICIQYIYRDPFKQSPPKKQEQPERPKTAKKQSLPKEAAKPSQAKLDDLPSLSGPKKANKIVDDYEDDFDFGPKKGKSDKSKVPAARNAKF